MRPRVEIGDDDSGVFARVVAMLAAAYYGEPMQESPGHGGASEPDLAFLFPTVGTVPFAFVERALSSIAEHRGALRSQVVVVDNSQNADFGARLEAYCERHLPDATIHRTPARLSLNGNWNLALSQSAARWLIYVHDDDYVLALPPAVPAAGSDEALVRGSTLYRWEGTGRERLVAPAPGSAGIVADCPKFCSTLIRRAALEAAGGWDESLGYFSDLGTLLCLHLRHGSAIDTRLRGCYRLHGANVSLHDRGRNYGDHLPALLAKVFAYTEDEELRRQLLVSVRWLLHPPRGPLGRIVRALECRLRGRV